MQVAAQRKVLETGLSYLWFDEAGIFCSITKPDVTITKERLQVTFNYIRSQVGDKNICWLGDNTQASFPTDEARDFAGDETPKIIKALA